LMSAELFSWKTVGERIERMYTRLATGYRSDLCGSGSGSGAQSMFA